MDASHVVTACRRLSAAMDAFESSAASRLGVNRNDLRALNLLEHGPVSQSAIAEALGITRPSVTALVDRLEAAGLVRRTAVAGDRRTTLVELLPPTWQAFARVYRPVGDAVGGLAEAWSPRRRNAVAVALVELAEVFEDAARP